MKLPTISLVIVAVCFGPYGWINATPSSAIVDSLNQVSLDFFKVALKNEPDNFVFLPLGISQLLAMTAFGAGGETRSELQKFLHMENLTDNLNNYTSDFMTKLDSVLNLQSMIFINQNIKLKSNFKNSNVNQINFENSRDATSIIKWFIYQKTKRDMDLFKPDDIKKNDSIFLINVNHFEAEWQNRFRPEYTSSKLFYLNNTSKIHVPTMKLWDWFLIVKNKDLDARIIQLFYRINDDYEQVSMFIIIPNKIEGLKHIEDNIDKINFTTLIDPGYDNQLTEIQLLLPKFKLDTKIDYKKHLEKARIL
ncbi:hypothetical protein HCN44_004934 [Aphidius gifuensis]|uniref:Serpin domain-containing protein n=1 Tax=Aphidius gifuensis TaxID=684658 RepID=A0A834XV18_APHGI|nr:hypothetical protein HCN44_004934 [Aphidius gifuensis]